MSYKESKEGKYNVRTYNTGTKRWFLNGVKHREDGPAVEWSDGSKVWYSDGLIHREDGPAIVYASGSNEWFLDGVLVYNKHTNNLKDYPNITEQFKRSVILYELQRS